MVEFWDIAGLVKGASKGEGLGNKFLAEIRNVSAIVHVVRAFTKESVTHVENSIDPKRDIELINTELALKDLETIAMKLSTMRGRARADRKLQPLVDMLEALDKHLQEGKLASAFTIDAQDKEAQELYQSLFLLTSKPVIYLVNSEDSKMAQNIELIKSVVPAGAIVIGMDIKLEAEIANLPVAERDEYLQELGMAEPAIARLTREAYKLLGLISFFTVGEDEVRAWTITQGSKAPQAAGTIHTDFEKKFITSDVVKYEDFLSAGGWVGAKEQGKARLGGKEYIVQDGDIMVFKHNA